MNSSNEILGRGKSLARRRIKFGKWAWQVETSVNGKWEIHESHIWLISFRVLRSPLTSTMSQGVRFAFKYNLRLQDPFCSTRSICSNHRTGAAHLEDETYIWRRCLTLLHFDYGTGWQASGEVVNHDLRCGDRKPPCP